MSDAVGKWLLEYLRRISCVWKDRRIVIVGDNDDAGRAGAQATAELLKKAIDKEIQVGYPPANLKDVREWIREGKFVSGWPFTGTKGVAR